MLWSTPSQRNKNFLTSWIRCCIGLSSEERANYWGKENKAPNICLFWQKKLKTLKPQQPYRPHLLTFKEVSPSGTKGKQQSLSLWNTSSGKILIKEAGIPSEKSFFIWGPWIELKKCMTSDGEKNLSLFY